MTGVVITALRGVWAWVTCDVYVAEAAARARGGVR